MFFSKTKQLNFLWANIFLFIVVIVSSSLAAFFTNHNYNLIFFSFLFFPLMFIGTIKNSNYQVFWQRKSVYYLLWNLNFFYTIASISFVVGYKNLPKYWLITMAGIIFILLFYSFLKTGSLKRALTANALFLLNYQEKSFKKALNKKSFVLIEVIRFFCLFLMPLFVFLLVCVSSATGVNLAITPYVGLIAMVLLCALLITSCKKIKVE